MVSIVMPAYNAAKTIRESVESVLNQTVDDWELLVIDDGSRDNTPQILAEFVKKDDRIVFLTNKENRGVSYTRNKAISLAKGEWIAFLDSDDIWREDKLEKQLALAELHPDMVVCYTASSFINDEGQLYEYIMPAIERLTYKQLLRKNLMSCSSVMVRSSVMKEIRMPNDQMHEDYYVWLTVVKECGVAYGINEPLLVYRLCANSKSSNRLKSAKMLYNSYRAVGYCCFATWLMVFLYTFHSISKRRNIRRPVLH
jgi:teichuronic acid biosynthesis glycosyltransferase TuaG